MLIIMVCYLDYSTVESHFFTKVALVAPNAFDKQRFTLVLAGKKVESVIKCFKSVVTP